VCLPDQHQVSLAKFPINFDSNVSGSLPPPLGLNIYNLILGLLLADIAINLHKFSECEVPSSFKDFVDMATTASGAGAAAFMAFLAVLCLTAIMSLTEEYESLSSRTEEDKGNCPLLNKFLIPTLAASVSRRGARFCGGRRFYGCPSFQSSIHDTISIWLITHHIIQKGEAICFKTWLSLQ
jgi:hypothetical protein